MSDIINTTQYLKFNGLYRTDYIPPDDNCELGYFSYLRFYEDGRVLGASSVSASAEKVSSWLKFGNGGSENISKGIYKRQGFQIFFTLRAENVRVDYYGDIQERRIKFDTYSHLTEFSDKSFFYFIG